MPQKFDLDVTTIGQLLDDPHARAILDEIVPELATHPMVSMVRGTSANTAIALAGGRVPADTVAQLKERLLAL